MHELKTFLKRHPGCFFFFNFKNHHNGLFQITDHSSFINHEDTCAVKIPEAFVTHFKIIVHMITRLHLYTTHIYFAYPLGLMNTQS